jgi:glycine cleavage system regulatory protein
MFPTSEPDYAPQTGMENRLVIQESYLSLLVKDVTDTRNKIVSHAQSVGGYMVNSNTNNPEESPTATVIVRVPATKLEETLSVYRAMGIKVVNENLTGRDVTDQYVDIDTRIEQLEKTKAKLEELLDRATLIADITNLTQQILSYQSQIDSYIGQQEALKKNADLTKLTVYLSTDEIALPYTPSEKWRPGVIFKLAVRSLVGSLRDLGEFIIWAGVYSVIWVPALLIFWYVRRRMNSNKKVESTSYKN